MHVISDPIKEVRAAALARLRDLETALTAHGFTVDVEAKFWALTVTAAADKLSPMRVRRVQLATDPRGNLDWYWVRDALADVEHLAPAAAITEATEVIAHALRRGDDQ